MRPILILAAGTATLLLTGCAADQPVRHIDVATQPGSTVAVTSSPSSETPLPPASSASSASPQPSTPTPSTAPARVSSAPVPHTHQVVLRPVTATGRVAPGYTLATEPDGQLLCGGSSAASESPVAVDDGIEGCSPSAEYAVACWAGPTPNTARCFRDPWKRQVVQIGTEGPLSSVRAPEVPSPLGLELSDGARCSIRDGGAWGQLVGHPELYGTYSCSNGEDVWAPRDSYGVNRTHPLWTVRLANDAGRGPLHAVGVLTAYFVGTSTSS